MSKKTAVVLPHALYWGFFLFICVSLLINPIDMNYSFISSFAVIFFVFSLSPTAPAVSALWVMIIELKWSKEGKKSRNRPLHTVAGILGCIAVILYAFSVFGLACGLFDDAFTLIYSITLYYSVFAAIAIYSFWLACVLRNKSYKKITEFKYKAKSKDENDDN